MVRQKSRANHGLDEPAGGKPRVDFESLGVLESARYYARLGWSVIPIMPRLKRPMVPWREFEQRAASLEEIDAWYRHSPDANVGVVTGRVSGLVVIDVDPAHGGSESLERLLREHGPLEHGLEVITGGGGRHLYFAHPAETISNRAGIFPGIDVRGDGGCVVVPPSIHPSGKRYRWAEGRAPGERDLTPLPPWAIQMLIGSHKLAHPPRH